MINPVVKFKAVPEGKVYPEVFDTDAEIDPKSTLAKTALILGCLSDEDAAAVRAAHDMLSPSEEVSGAAAAQKKKADAAAAAKNKADAATVAKKKVVGAPEDKGAAT